MTIRETVCCLCLASLLAACVEQKPAASHDTDEIGGFLASPLAGTQWLLTEYSKDGATQPAAESAWICFEENGRCRGYAGCNDFYGEYENLAASTALSFSSVSFTLQGCFGDGDEQENAVRGWLLRVAGYGITDGDLTMLDENGDDLLAFCPVPSSIEGTEWMVGLVNHGDGLSSTSGDLTLSFGTDGGVSGFGGCNSYTAFYHVLGDAISIWGLQAEKDICTDEEEESEQLFFDALQEASFFSACVAQLWLWDEDGHTQVASVRHVSCQQ
jgi:heat shock protein HslJ